MTRSTRVGIELASIWRPGGISDNRVAAGLLRGLTEAAPRQGVEIVIAVDQNCPESDRQALPFESVRFKSGPRLIANSTTLSHSFQRASVDSALFHHFPPLRFKGIDFTLVHDIIHRTDPTAFRPVHRHYLNSRRLLCGRHRQLVTVSDHSKSQLISHGYGISPNIHLVKWGADFAEATSEPSPEIASAVREPFALVVGRISNRKQPLDIAHAFRHLEEEGSIVFAGPIEDDALAVQLAGESRVVLLGQVADSDLEWLYAHCELTVVASRSEGFGMPVVEALVRGVPVVARAIPPFVEVSSGYRGCSFFQTERELRTAIAETWHAVQSGAFHVDQQAAAAEYTWQRSAQQLLDILTSTPCTQ